MAGTAETQPRSQQSTFMPCCQIPTLKPHLEQVNAPIDPESKVKKYIPVHAIRELHTSDEAKNYRDQFQPAGRWLTVDSTYKMIHLLAPSKEIMEAFALGLSVA
ncbi:hypothetical protein C8F01DRAFT_1343582 [Mycena amicta]|nr:hypothetical protein C8F01DRAFT_1343582 [Mycena amicta]